MLFETSKPYNTTTIYEKMKQMDNIKPHLYYETNDIFLDYHKAQSTLQTIAENGQKLLQKPSQILLFSDGDNKQLKKSQMKENQEDDEFQQMKLHQRLNSFTKLYSDKDANKNYYSIFSKIQPNRNFNHLTQNKPLVNQEKAMQNCFVQKEKINLKTLLKPKIPMNLKGNPNITSKFELQFANTNIKKQPINARSFVEQKTQQKPNSVYMQDQNTLYSTKKYF